MNQYSSLAKETIEKYIKNGETISSPEELPKKMDRKAGTFVTIIKNGDLRGCIGTFLPTKENIAQEIISNAIVAATKDYRFEPIKESELNQLSYEVSILSEPEIIKNIGELDPKKFGIIVKTANPPLKSALLLPDIEGVDTVKKQISITCRKGDINPETEEIEIYKFKVEKY